MESIFPFYFLIHLRVFIDIWDRFLSVKCIPLILYWMLQILLVANITKLQYHYLLKTINKWWKNFQITSRLYFTRGLKKICVLTIMEILVTCLNNGIHVKKMSRYISTESNDKIFTTSTFALYSKISLILYILLRASRRSHKDNMVQYLSLWGHWRTER